MLDEPDAAELRRLRSKAYGRDGGLTAAELARLHELEHKRGSSVTAPPLSGTEPPSVTEPVEVPETEAPPPSTGSGIGGSELSVTEPVEVHERVGGRRWTLLAAASAALLVIGVGIGWGIWGQRDLAIPLTDEQRAWQDDVIAAGEYDPGSVFPVDEHEGVVAWVATKDAGKRTCVLMSNGIERSEDCRLLDDEPEGIASGELRVPSATNADNEDVTITTVVYAADGQPASVMQKYQYSQSRGVVFEPEDQAIADILIDQGYGADSLWIVGYFEDVPIWTASSADGRGQTCLIYAAPKQFAEACGEWHETEDGLTLSFLDGTHDDLRAVDIAMRSLQSGPQYVTITVQPVSGVSEVTIDSETGEIQIDDKTGN